MNSAETRLSYIDICDGCWRRNVLATKMLVTVFAVFVTNILYILTLASDTQKLSSKIVTKIKSPTSTVHQNLRSPRLNSIDISCWVILVTVSWLSPTFSDMNYCSRQKYNSSYKFPYALLNVVLVLFGDFVTRL